MTAYIQGGEPFPIGNPPPTVAKAHEDHYPGKVLPIKTTQTREVVTNDLIDLIQQMRRHKFLSSEDEAQRLAHLLWQAGIVKKV